MNTYFWEFKPDDLRWFAFAIVGAMVCIRAGAGAAEAYQKQTILVGALAGTMVLAMLKVLFRFADIWPDNGDPWLLVALVIHTPAS